MEHSRKQKLFIVVALFVAIASLSVGFAAFSTTLNISSSASVNPNSDNFKVKFSTSQNSLTVTAVTPSSNSNGLTASNGSINNTTQPTLTNLSATFTSPGQYVEYTVYARNEGEYTAYLNSVNFLGEKTCEPVGNTTPALVTSACNSINTVVYVASTEYRETTPISNHSLAKSSSEQIRIRLEYASNGTSVDGDFRITFNDIMLVYSTINDSTYMPTYGTSNMTGTLNSKIKADTLFKGTDANVNFWKTPTTGVYVRSGTENHVNPIYYYRGAVTNNNVFFAGKCWKIVRTTETGGTKLIYNGTPTSDNKCNGDNSMIGWSAYNDNCSSTDDVSYIYSDGTNSTIKQTVDTWYTSNMASYTDMLEDTVWCNDRSITFSGYHEDWSTDVTFFGAYARNATYGQYQPSLHCPAEYSLTTSSTLTSNKLTYPVGLLTADELTLAGMGWSSYTEDVYLNNYDWWWTMSPFTFEPGYARVFGGSHSGDLIDAYVYVETGVRPSVSLKPGAYVSTGNGTSSSPYVIE